MVYKRDVIQIAILQIKRMEKVNETAWSNWKTQVGCTYKLLSTHFLKSIPIFNAFHPIKNYNM